MGELTEAGCVAFSQADVPLVDTQVLLRAMQYAATFGYRGLAAPAGCVSVRVAASRTTARSRRVSALPAIPSCAETIALDTIFALARSTGARVHLCTPVDARGRAAQVREAKRSGLALTCDVAIHHLHLCDIDIGWFDANCHVIPPLRGDIATVRRCARASPTGRSTSICSDHAPVDDDAKQLPFAEGEPGATGLELLLPLTLKWAREAQRRLPQALACDHRRDPAQVLGIDAGHLAVGAPADVCVFDPEAWWTVDRRSLHSQGKNTPFLGVELAGKVRFTVVAGQLVHES